MTDLAARVILATLREGRAARWVVRGGSMWPAVPDGSEVLVTPCDPMSLREGEIAAFARGPAVVVHRVIARRPGALRFRGDTFAGDDGWVPLGDVLGRAAVTRRGPLGWALPGRAKLRGLARAAREWLRARGQP